MRLLPPHFLCRPLTRGDPVTNPTSDRVVNLALRIADLCEKYLSHEKGKLPRDLRKLTEEYEHAKALAPAPRVMPDASET